jgi:hypothetical protein
MTCGGINLPDANFCGKCASPFPGVAVAAKPPAPQVTPQVTRQPVSQGGGGGAHYERAPVPSLSKRDRNQRGRRQQQPEPEELEEVEAAVEVNDPEDGVSLNYVPQLSRLEFEVEPAEQVKKIDVGGLLDAGFKDYKSKNSTPKRARKSK